MLPFPTEPEVPETQRATGSVHVRYDDVVQDGRVRPATLTYPMGTLLWGGPLGHHPVIRAGRTHGIIPILSRLVLEGGGGPVSVAHRLEARAGFQLAHSAGEGGAVERLFLNTWVSVFGNKARTHGPPPAGAGESVCVGRAFSEHVFTKPFGPPADRKVLAFELDGAPPVPPDRHVFRPPMDLLDLPPGASWLEAELRPAPEPIVFGLSHTDSNQHVNSLTYPRLFEDAALRRLVDLGHDGRLYATHLEVAYRKPCFAGETVRVLMRAFRLDGALGVLGSFVHDPVHAEASARSRPACTLRMLLVR